jgi:S-adenosylmethionine hydrolase
MKEMTFSQSRKTKPIQTQFKANFRKAKMNVNSLITKDYRKNDEFFLLEGSNNTLEISLKNGNANDKLHIETGEKIKIS